MSVIMTMHVQGDRAKLEQLAAQNGEAMRGTTERAKQHGLIAHRFYASDDGQLMIIDEWPDAESFQRFFEQERAQIEPMMREVATTEPTITFWRKVETGDDVGWGA